MGEKSIARAFPLSFLEVAEGRSCSARREFMYWVVPTASGDFLGLGKSMDGPASCSPTENLSTADLTEEPSLDRRRGALGDSVVDICAGVPGDFGVLEEKRTRCSRVVVLQ